MAKELEQPVGPIPDEENFAALFEKFMKETDLTPFLAEKDVRASNRKNAGPINNYDVFRLFSRGLKQKRDGMLEESYLSFESMLQGGNNMPKKARFLSYMNLADNAHQISKTPMGKEGKIKWLVRTQEWTDKALEARVQEFPQGVFYVAILSGKARNDHAAMEKDPIKKRELLQKAYEDVVSIADLIPPFNSGWTFVFQTTLHQSARSLPLLVDDPAEKKLWYERWFNHAKESAELSAEGKNPLAENIYTYSASNAALYIGNGEIEESEKRKWYLTASQFVEKALALNEYSDSEFIPRKYKVAALITNNLTRLALTDEEQKYWYCKNIEYNEACINLPETDAGIAADQVRMCIRNCGILAQMDTENREHWVEKRNEFVNRLSELNSGRRR